MIEDLTQSFEDAELKKQDVQEEGDTHDPLTQLVTTFCRGAMTERSGALQVIKILVDVNIFDQIKFSN